MTGRTVGPVAARLSRLTASARHMDVAALASLLGTPIAELPIDLLIAQSREAAPDAACIREAAAAFLANSGDLDRDVDRLLGIAEVTTAVIELAAETFRRAGRAHPLTAVHRGDLMDVTVTHDLRIHDDRRLSFLPPLSFESTSSGAAVVLDQASPATSWILGEFARGSGGMAGQMQISPSSLLSDTMPHRAGRFGDLIDHFPERRAVSPETAWPGSAIVLSLAIPPSTLMS